jgi:ParB-like chromosome segregation protein Spo0J
MRRFGFLERIIVNDVTGRLIAGHGRIDTLEQLKRAGPPPEGIEAHNG